jgi:hypothetical protein
VASAPNVSWLFSWDNISHPLMYEFSSNGWIKILYNTDVVGIDGTEFGKRSSENGVQNFIKKFLCSQFWVLVKVDFSLLK